LFELHYLKTNILNNNIVVGCTVSEPEPGWLDNLNGLSSVVTPMIIGLLRVLHISTKKCSDIVPIDYTVNALISVMWNTVNRYNVLHVTHIRIAL